MFARYKEKIKQKPKLKQSLLNLMVHPVKTRPRLWLRLLFFAYTKRGKQSVIYKSVRKDIVPFNHFTLGDYSVVESFCVLNNMVGDISIGHHSRVGLNNTIIGPVSIGDQVNIAQNVVLSGLNHNYELPDQPIISQGVKTAPIVIENDVWIGANSTILAGIQIGSHSVIAAGSVVTRSVPPYSVCAGNPARIIKRYDHTSAQWIKS